MKKVLHKKFQATTLIELMVTMAILSIMMFMVFEILTLIIKTNQKTSTRLNIRDDVDFALTYLDFMLSNADPNSIECSTEVYTEIQWKDLIHNYAYQLKDPHSTNHILVIKKIRLNDPDDISYITLTNYDNSVQDLFLDCSSPYYDSTTGTTIRNVLIGLKVESNSLSETKAKTVTNYIRFKSVLIKN